ncbi:nuclear transport factor 2 family protein [Dyadobacter fanqingshengii]|uniref:Nuclear transport factor 2 family protein n=1 Tax=Dyadobacter fanqingshengii TaxID=2906443 RepID=A0A9X1PFB2_9BACT|nr:nuclear transport factor 2 family protein [Dyadobacter fanqingshengii]MCF0043487.1 nuclear transport factor 2 family protein [Dyadobacter fanqingshengii]USJ34894.1 nuclear transport factor 2 family protein [Dyadobacter fanqingshengii]
MKTLLLTILSLAFSFIAKAQTNVQPIDGLDCSNLFFKALLEEDAKALESLISNDFSVMGLQGQPIEGRALIQAVSQGIIVVDSGMLSAARTRTYGDVMLINGLWDVRARIENNGFQGALSYMSVCVNSGGRWKVVAVQFTPVP